MFKYMELYNNLKLAIEAGELSPGEKLPSETELCRRGYSRNTVRQALAELEKEQFIIKRHGSGSIVKPLRKKHQLSGNVALLFTSFDLYIFNDTLKGINDGLQGWATPLLYSSNFKIEEEERVLKELLQKKPDGLIVQAFNTALPNPNIVLYQKLIDEGIPVIFLYSYYEGLRGLLYVTNDDVQGATQVVRYLYEQGRRRLGGIFVTENRQFHCRYQGYSEECRRLQVPLQSERELWLSTNAFKNSAEMKKSVLALTSHCDAIVCSSDLHAEFVIDALLEEGIKVPKEVAIISFDNSYLCGYAKVPITSMDARPYEVGKIAAEKLRNLLNGQKEESVELPWHLVKRQSS